jgi:hypothetical protein
MPEVDANHLPAGGGEQTGAKQKDDEKQKAKFHECDDTGDVRLRSQEAHARCRSVRAFALTSRDQGRRQSGMSLTGKILAVLAIAAASQVVVAQNADEKQETVTMQKALKLGADGLTQVTGDSEVGQDQAAHLYATAKRIETEHVLAQRNLQLVIDLGDWREQIAQCRSDFYALAYIVNGGGTMYTHGDARDCASLEDFLADLAKRLPLAEGKGDPRAAKTIDDTMKFLKTLKPYDSGDAKEMKQVKANLSAQVKQTSGHFEALKGMISSIPAVEARKIAEFAIDPADWLKGDGK